MWPCVSRCGLLILGTSRMSHCLLRASVHQRCSIQSCTRNHWWENNNLSFTSEKLTKLGIGMVGGSYKHNFTRVLQLSNSTAKCFIHLPLLFGGRRSSPQAPAIILLVAFQWQYSQLPEALINKMKIHTAKLEHTTINNIFLFAGQVNSLCKELLCYPVRKESSAFLLFQK